MNHIRSLCYQSFASSMLFMNFNSDSTTDVTLSKPSPFHFFSYLFCSCCSGSCTYSSFCSTRFSSCSISCSLFLFFNFFFDLFLFFVLPIFFLTLVSDIRLATFLGDPQDGIGYINLSGFNSGAGRDFRQAMVMLRYVQHSIVQ